MLDDDLRDDDRQGRHGDADGQRQGPVRAAARHQARHRLRLLAVGVPGVRHRRRRRLSRRPTGGTCKDRNVAQGKTATASSSEGGNAAAACAVDGNAGTRWASSSPTTRVAGGPRGEPERSATSPSAGRAPTARPSTVLGLRQRTDVDDRRDGDQRHRGQPVGRGPGNGRYLRLDLQTRATGYGFSLWEVAISTTGGGTTDPPTETAAHRTAPSRSGRRQGPHHRHAGQLDAGGQRQEVGRQGHDVGPGVAEFPAERGQPQGARRQHDPHVGHRRGLEGPLRRRRDGRHPRRSPASGWPPAAAPARAAARTTSPTRRTRRAR